MRRFADVGHIRYIESSASISVSKLCNFHLPYLVTFVNKLVFSFFSPPKFLRLPVHTKYFVKNCLFVSLGRPQFSLFYLNVGPLVHLQ